MSVGLTAKVPEPLSLEKRSESWKHFKREWSFYEIATKISKEEDEVRIAALLNVIGREGVDLYETFQWQADEDKTKIENVVRIPRTNETYESYRFFKRSQNAGETVEAYITALYKLSATCNFGSLRERLIRDRLVIGVRDEQAREKLLAKENLNLETCIDMLKTLQVTHTRAQEMNTEITTHTVRYKTVPNKSPATTSPHNASYGNFPRRFNRTSTSKYTPISSRRALPSGEGRSVCSSCGDAHPKWKDKCPARGATCHTCGKHNHYAKMCRSRDTHQIVEVIHTVGMDRKTKAHATLTINDKVDVSFHMDTGSSVDILPYQDYVRSTEDHLCSKVEHTNIRLVMHNKSVVKPMGLARLRVHRKGTQIHMRVVVVRDNVVPLLSLQSCLGMDLIQINDCDAINAVVRQTNRHNRDKGTDSQHDKKETTQTISKSGIACPLKADTKHTSVNSKRSQVFQDTVLREYPDVFEGLGCLAGDYRIQIDASVRPVVHPPRRVPCALREDIKGELTHMVGDRIIAPVTEPTRWVSSMIAVRKKNTNKLRICLDPRDLNKAIQRSHYPLPTLEDVATRLTNAKEFSVLDAKSGFWQVKLEKDSSYLTTFNTPFGRYRWLRMPFGINSAPEEWQRRAHEVVEGLKGVEGVADDFLCIGFGDTIEEATRDHDANLRALLERARTCHLVLNPDKVQLRSKSVPFIGHILTDEGLKVDESKVEAIMKMPPPTDITALKRILGMVGYLAKFLPHLSEVCEPLRQLDRKDVEWCWLEQYQDVLYKIREMNTTTPVLAYYDVTQAITIQCDASQSGLGAVLLQEGKPVCYASRALTHTEENYAQIEKELLAIVFACERFDQYVYGRHITVQSDHKPLEIITKKSMIDAPKRLQRMLLRLQKYNIDVVYTKGRHAHRRHALSGISSVQPRT